MWTQNLSYPSVLQWSVVVAASHLYTPAYLNIYYLYKLCLTIYMYVYLQCIFFLRKGVGSERGGNYDIITRLFCCCCFSLQFWLNLYSDNNFWLARDFDFIFASYMIITCTHVREQGLLNMWRMDACPVFNFHHLSIHIRFFSRKEERSRLRVKSQNLCFIHW